MLEFSRTAKVFLLSALKEFVYTVCQNEPEQDTKCRPYCLRNQTFSQTINPFIPEFFPDIKISKSRVISNPLE